jgi:predicted outer membrane repeat protein
VENASFDITDCLFEGNQAAVAGGALYAANGEAGGPHGISDTRFHDNSANLLGAGVHIRNLPPGNAAGFVRVILSGQTTLGSGGGLSIQGCEADLGEATLAGNSASQGGGIHVADGTLSMISSLLAFNTGGAAVICEGASSATATCTNIFGNTGGDWIACLSGQAAGSDNLSADPEFCSTQPVVDRNFLLQSDSPCLPEGALCPQMGAEGAGCGPVPVEATTWGGLKRLFGSR